MVAEGQARGEFLVVADVRTVDDQGNWKIPGSNASRHDMTGSEGDDNRYGLGHVERRTFDSSLVVSYVLC